MICLVNSKIWKIIIKIVNKMFNKRNRAILIIINFNKSVFLMLSIAKIFFHNKINKKKLFKINLLAIICLNNNNNKIKN